MFGELGLEFRITDRNDQVYDIAAIIDQLVALGSVPVPRWHSK